MLPSNKIRYLPSDKARSFIHSTSISCIQCLQCTRYCSSIGTAVEITNTLTYWSLSSSVRTTKNTQILILIPDS